MLAYQICMRLKNNSKSVSRNCKSKSTLTFTSLFEGHDSITAAFSETKVTRFVCYYDNQLEDYVVDDVKINIDHVRHQNKSARTKFVSGYKLYYLMSNLDCYKLY